MRTIILTISMFLLLISNIAYAEDSMRTATSDFIVSSFVLYELQNGECGKMLGTNTVQKTEYVRVLNKAIPYLNDSEKEMNKDGRLLTQMIGLANESIKEIKKLFSQKFSKLRKVDAAYNECYFLLGYVGGWKQSKEDGYVRMGGTR